MNILSKRLHWENTVLMMPSDGGSSNDDGSGNGEAGNGQGGNTDGSNDGNSGGGGDGGLGAKGLGGFGAKPGQINGTIDGKIGFNGFDDDGNPTFGEVDTQSTEYGFTDAISASFHSFMNAVGPLGRTAIGLAVAGIPGAVKGAITGTHTMTTEEEAALDDMAKGFASTVGKAAADKSISDMDFDNAMNGGDFNSIINNFDTINKGASIEPNADGNYVPSSSIKVSDRGRGGLIQQAYVRGLGREPTADEYNTWFKSPSTTASIVEDMKQAARDSGTQFTEFDLNSNISTSGAINDLTRQVDNTNTAYAKAKGMVNDSYSNNMDRGQLIQEAYKQGLGREPTADEYNTWYNSPSDTNTIVDDMKQAARDSGLQFTEFDINKKFSNSSAQVMAGQNIDLAKSQLQIAEGQLAGFEDFYGNPLENYNSWFTKLDPYQAQALGQSEIKANYQAVSDQAIANFAQRGITDSGLLSSVMVNFDVQEAEALAANRAQNMANYTAIAQQDAAIQSADVNNRFNARNMLTSNTFNASNNLALQNTALGNLKTEESKYNIGLDIAKGQTLAGLETAQAGANSTIYNQAAGYENQLEGINNNLAVSNANIASNQQARDDANNNAMYETIGGLLFSDNNYSKDSLFGSIFG